MSYFDLRHIIGYTNLTGKVGQALIVNPAEDGFTLSPIGATFDGSYNSLTGIPATFAPSAHVHTIADITSLQGILDGKQAELISGTSIKTINGVSILGSGDMVISGGGSGTVNSGTANRLAYYVGAGTAVSELAAITANRALISNASGLPIASTVTNTELAYVGGVTSSIQTQLGTKQATLVSGTSIKTLNGVSLLGSGDIVLSGGGDMIYPGAGIPLSTGTAWGTSITDNSANWNTAYTDRLKWDGGATDLVAATGRISLGLVIGTNVQAYSANLTTFAGIAPSADVQAMLAAANNAAIRTAIGAGTSSTTGTVTTASVVSANGFAGTVATATTTPAITLSTTITGMLKGNGTALQLAIAGTDYVIPSGNITGTSLNVTGTVAVANGGTGAVTLTGVLIGNGTGVVTGITGTANQLLRRNAANTAYEFFTPTYGTSNFDGVYSSLTGIPSTFAPSAHTHTKADITDFTHTHAISDVTGLQAALDGKEPGLGNPGTDGYVLSSTAAGVRSWVVQSGGGGGTPAGSTTQLQFNNAGAFGASSDLTWGSGTLTVNGNTIINSQLLRGVASSAFDVELRSSSGSGGIRMKQTAAASTHQFFQIETASSLIPFQVSGTGVVSMTGASSISLLDIYNTGVERGRIQVNAAYGGNANGCIIISSGITSGGFNKPPLGIYNSRTAAINEPVDFIFNANRTTGGITPIANIQGIITDIGSTTYKGDLVFHTADGAAPAERMRITHLGNVDIDNLSDGTGVPRMVVTTNGVLSYQNIPSGGGGDMVYPGAGIALSTGSAWGTSITDNSTNWNTAFTQTRQWDGGATGLTAATGRTSLGATTLGGNLFTIANNSATIKWLRINVDNTTTLRTAAETLTDIGAQASGSYQVQLSGTGFIKAVGTTISYDNTTYVPTTRTINGTALSANVTLTTTDIAQGTNLYYTDAAVRAVLLTGLSTASSATITASDSVLGAFGKLQAQVTGISGSSGANALGTYLVQTATNAPANAQVLASLATGILKVTTTTGVMSVAVAGTDYLTPTGSAASLTGFPTFNQNTTGTASNITGIAAVANGGTGVATLTGMVVGNGASAMTAVTGTASQLLRRNAGNTAYEFFTPTYITANQSITLSGAVTGSGTTAITTTLATNIVANTNIRQSVATSLIGRSANTTGDVADIAATADGQFMVRRSSALTWATIVAGDIPTLNQSTTGSAATLTTGRTISTTGDVTYTSGSFNGSANVTGAAIIANNVVTNAKLATVATQTFKGRTTAATGNVEDLTVTQATAMLNLFSSTLKGLVPLSGGGTTNFLRADGTWAVPVAGTSLNGTGVVVMVGTSPSYITGTENQLLRRNAADTDYEFFTAPYLTGNQTITLSGNVTGSGTTSITTTIAAGVVTNAMLAGSIAASKLIGTDIATVGIIGTGTWQGDQIGNTYVADLPTSKITSGIFSAARLASGTATNGYAITSVSGTPTWTDNATYMESLGAGQTLLVDVDANTLGIKSLVAGTNITLDTATAGQITINGASGLTNPMTTTGDIIYGGASGAATRLAGAAGFLKSTGAAAPTWSALAAGDIASGTFAAARYGATTIPISAINATGTPSSSTYLRGDGTWQTVSGGGDAALASTQTFTGVNTFNRAGVNTDAQVILKSNATQSASITANVLEVKTSADVLVGFIRNDGFLAGARLGTADNTTAVLAQSTSGNITLGWNYRNTAQLAWSSGANWWEDAKDVGLARNAAGILEVNNGTTGTLRDLATRNLTATTGITINAVAVPTISSSNTLTNKTISADSNTVTNIERSVGFSAQSPTASENLFLFRAPAGGATAVDGVVVMGGTSPSVTYTIHFGTTYGTSTGTVVASNAVTTTGTMTINTSAIPANAYVWLVTTAVSGTITQFAPRLNYKY